MKTTFLGQGYEISSTNAVGKHLIAYLSDTRFHSFTGISAFASEAGIYGLSGHIQSAKQTFQNLTLVVGVDQEGTSKEALEELLALNIESYIFYQPEAPIFHPKIYLFEGTNDIKLIIGSSNLTGRGLFTNVESSVLIEFDTNDTEGATLLFELKSYYQSLFDFSDPNLFKISTTIIADFIAQGIVPDEATRRRMYAKKINISSPSAAVPSANTNISIPRPGTARVPSSFPVKSQSLGLTTNATSAIVTTSTPVVGAQPVQIAPGQIKTLVWEKPSLSQSDAQRVPAGTAVTANLKLSQARFKVNNIVIDQTTYFRNQVFNTLTWSKAKLNSNTYEEAICGFDINILGNPIGVHNLKLSHDTVRIAGQGNTPTWLHWGNTVKPFLQQFDITGKTFKLYQANQTYFIEVV